MARRDSGVERQIELALGTRRPPLPKNFSCRTQIGFWHAAILQLASAFCLSLRGNGVHTSRPRELISKCALGNFHECPRRCLVFDYAFTTLFSVPVSLRFVLCAAAIVIPAFGSDSPLRGDFPYPSRYIQVRGVAMHYVESGHGDPILLLHGNPTSVYIWR